MTDDRWLNHSRLSLEDVYAETDLDTMVELSPDVRVPPEVKRSYRHAELGLVASLHVVVRDGTPTVRSLTLDSANDDARGLDRDRLRAVPLAELSRRALAGVARVRREDGWFLGAWHGDSSSREAHDRLSPPGRPLGIEELEEVARIYREHEGPRPVVAVAEHFRLSSSGAAKRVLKARRAGLLPPTTKGKATNRKDDR